MITTSLHHRICARGGSAAAGKCFIASARVHHASRTHAASGTPVRIRFWASILMAGGKRRAGDGVGIVWRGPELRLSVKSGERQRRRRDIAQDPRTLSSIGGAMPGRGTVASAGDGKVRLGWDSGDENFNRRCGAAGKAPK